MTAAEPHARAHEVLAPEVYDFFAGGAKGVLRGDDARRCVEAVLIGRAAAWAHAAGGAEAVAELILTLQEELQ